MIEKASTEQIVCGLDEAGRGPMAGPVCAASVILPSTFDITLLNDSKKLSEKKRNEAMCAIYSHATAWGLGWASSAEIDTLNILKASLLAMKRSFFDMKNRFPVCVDYSSLEVVIDGLYCPEGLNGTMRAIPRADALFPSVMAASILAKTARDRMMIRYSWLYPDYGYERHKGYATQAHIAALKKYGPSPIQRKKFRLKGEGQLKLF